MRHIYAIVCVAAIALVVFVAIESITPNLNRMFAVGAISIGNRSANVYIASSTAQQVLGYMYQSSIGNCDGKGSCIGMLFVFNGTGTECFWMHNTKILLRQYWIENGSVVYGYLGKPLSNGVICHVGNEVLETTLNLSVGEHVALSHS